MGARTVLFTPPPVCALIEVKASVALMDLALGQAAVSRRMTGLGAGRSRHASTRHHSNVVPAMRETSPTNDRGFGRRTGVAARRLCRVTRNPAGTLFQRLSDRAASDRIMSRSQRRHRLKKNP